MGVSVQENRQLSVMQKNPDLERLEIALVQLGFALEQQEIQAEAERTEQKEMRQALLDRIDALEARLRTILEMDAGALGAAASPETEEEER